MKVAFVVFLFGLFAGQTLPKTASASSTDDHEAINLGVRPRENDAENEYVAEQDTQHVEKNAWWPGRAHDTENENFADDENEDEGESFWWPGRMHDTEDIDLGDGEEDETQGLPSNERVYARPIQRDERSPWVFNTIKRLVSRRRRTSKSVQIRPFQTLSSGSRRRQFKLSFSGRRRRRVWGK